MLQKINEKIKGWVAGIIFALIALIFSVWGLEYYLMESRDRGETVATVDGVKISQSQAERAYRESLAQFKQAQPQRILSPQEISQLKAMSLQQLVNAVAIEQQLMHMGFRFSSAEAARIIQSQPALQTHKQFDPKKLDRLLAVRQMTEQQFLQQIQQLLLTEQAGYGLATMGFAAFMQERFLQLWEQKRFGHYVEIPLSAVAEPGPVSARSIEAYYQANKTQFVNPVAIKFAYLHLSLERVTSDIAIPSDQVRAYYDKNRTLIYQKQSFDQVRERIIALLKQQQARRRLAQMKEQFANLAYMHADRLDMVAKQLGIPLKQTSWLSSDTERKPSILNDKQLAPRLFSASFLEQAQQTTAPIQLSDGSWVVIRLLAKKQSTVKPLEEVRKVILAHLTRRQLFKSMDFLAYQIRSRIRQGSAIGPWLKAKGLTWRAFSAISVKDSRLPEPLVAAIFSKQPRSEHEPGVGQLRYADGRLVVYQVDRAQLPPRAAVEPQTAQRHQLLAQYRQSNSQLLEQLVWQVLLKRSHVTRSS